MGQGHLGVLAEEAAEWVETCREPARVGIVSAPVAVPEFLTREERPVIAWTVPSVVLR